MFILDKRELKGGVEWDWEQDSCLQIAKRLFNGRNTKCIYRKQVATIRTKGKTL